MVKYLIILACLFGCATILEEEYEMVYTSRYYWHKLIDDIIDVNYELSKEEYEKEKKDGTITNGDN